MSQLTPEIPRMRRPHGIDRVIDSLQTTLGILPWLERIFGRAMPYQENRQREWIKVPKVLDVGGQYVSVLPNDRFRGMSFFQTAGPERRVPDSTSQLERDLSLIVWVKLDTIEHPRAPYQQDYKAELAEEVREALRRAEYVESTGVLYDQDAQEVYEGYSLTEAQSHYMSYPYSGFRLTLTVRYLDFSGC